MRKDDMVQWLMIILAYDFAILKLSLSEVTLSLRLLHYKNQNGSTYDGRSCDTKIEHDINRDGRCDTAFLFCLVRLPFQNPHNCTLGDHFTGFVGGDDIHFININQKQDEYIAQGRSTSISSLWFQPIIHFRFRYPKVGVGMIVEVFDIDDINNHSIHDSIDFYGRTLLDLKIYRSEKTAQTQRILLRSLFGTNTNLTADFGLYCSPNYYGPDCETYCFPNVQRYDCNNQTGQKICKQGYLGPDCLTDDFPCENEPCLNNGTCVVYLQSYLCQCSKGFSGRHCEIGATMRIMEPICNRTNCVHGDCTITGSCFCHEGWTSKTCNQTKTGHEVNCASHPCLHNSTCETLSGIYPMPAYRCHCPLGYMGQNCEMVIGGNCEKTRCVHGQCFKLDIYTEVCVCEKDWTGTDCSQKNTIVSTTVSPKTMTTKTSSFKFFETTKSIIGMNNRTNTSSKQDLHEYLIWLQENYGITQPTNLLKQSTVTMKKWDVQHEHSPCSSTPCLHNSTCVVKSKNSFQCICLPSYFGVLCEIEQNPCESSPCQHQSVCITKSHNQIQCICRPHYTGKFCEYPEPLQLPSYNQKCNRICHNDGICLIDESNQEQCVCKPAYTGSSCEITKRNCSNPNDPSCNVNPCLSNPCLSNGTCRWLTPKSNYTCLCHEEYTGEHCEYKFETDSKLDQSGDANVHQGSTNTTNLWPLAIVFGYVFSLMLVFIIIWFLWYGLTIRPQSYAPYGESVNDRYQPYRLGVSNPIFFTNQEHITPISKTYSTPPTSISNLDQWTRTTTR